MYTQIFFVTSVRGIFLPPQILASGSLKAFGAKIPTPFFFMAAVVFVDFVIAIKRLECKHALSLEPPC